MLVSIKANCIDSTAKPEVVFASEVQKLRSERIKPKEQLTLGESDIVDQHLGVTYANELIQSRSNVTIVWWPVSTLVLLDLIVRHLLRRRCSRRAGYGMLTSIIMIAC